MNWDTESTKWFVSSGERKLSYKTTKHEGELLVKISKRAKKLAKAYNFDIDRKWVMTALILCHANGCRLAMAKMLKLPDLEFVEEITMIAKNLDQATGRLKGEWRPECEI